MQVENFIRHNREDLDLLVWKALCLQLDALRRGGIRGETLMAPALSSEEGVKRKDATNAELTDRVGSADTETGPNATLRLELY